MSNVIQADSLSLFWPVVVAKSSPCESLVSRTFYHQRPRMIISHLQLMLFFIEAATYPRMQWGQSNFEVAIIFVWGPSIIDVYSEGEGGGIPKRQSE